MNWYRVKYRQLPYCPDSKASIMIVESAKEVVNLSLRCTVEIESVDVVSICGRTTQTLEQIKAIDLEERDQEILELQRSISSGKAKVASDSIRLGQLIARKHDYKRKKGNRYA